MNMVLTHRTREEAVSPWARQWAQAAIRRLRKTANGAPKTAPRNRRCLIVHLDGVPKSLLQEGIAQKQMPFLARLVGGGAYGLDSAFWGSPASTPYFQASLLYGLPHPNLPAYHWFDRQLGRQVHMNTPSDTLLIEKRLEGQARSSLLEGGGTAYMSLFRADASNLLSMSALENKKMLVRGLPNSLRGIRGAARRSVPKFLCGTAKDFWDSVNDVASWVSRINDWRFEREFLFNHFFLASLGWNFCCSRSVMDMVSGVPVIYLVYGSYDEVSHRRGPFSPQARRDLFRVDEVLERLYAVAKGLEQPYDVYILTDHGHVDSAPFERRTGKPLQQYVSWGDVPVLPPDVERGLLDGRPLPQRVAAVPSEDPVVIDAGNFAHVYVSRGPRPLEALEILENHRDILARVVSQPDIGVVVLRRGTGAVAVVRNGIYGPDQIDSAPLAASFSRRALKDLLSELPLMPNAGDLVLYGQAVSNTGTVGFAWEFGSHGGLTKIETDSVMMWPLDGPVDLSGLSSSIQLHHKLSEAYRN